jgi:hypothetical protein
MRNWFRYFDNHEGRRSVGSTKQLQENKVGMVEMSDLCCPVFLNADSGYCTVESAIGAAPMN